MTVDEAKRLKEDLEKTIADLCKRYTDEAGLAIVSISIYAFNSVDSSLPVAYRVEIDAII